MRQKIIDITSYIGSDLKSRSSVRLLLHEVNKIDNTSLKIDFKNVDFASRSFMDEFYNQFIVNKELDVTLVNVSPELQQLIDSVKSTQNKSKTYMCCIFKLQFFQVQNFFGMGFVRNGISKRQKFGFIYF